MVNWRWKGFFVVALIAGSVMVPLAHGETITAASASRADVQAAIDAAVTGDIVMVPPGNRVWNGEVSIPNTKRIALMGAGMDATVITRSPAGTAVNLGQSGSRLSGFRFNNGGVLVDGDGWRIDHNMFSSDVFALGVRSRGLDPSFHPRGVIDNCVFVNTRVYAQTAELMANELWAQSSRIGTADAIFVEDSSFTFTDFGNFIDANYGGRYVFRYNTVDGAYAEAHSVQGTHRGTRSWEIYGNSITSSATTYNPWTVMLLRGGTGVVFDNAVSGTFGQVTILLNNVRSAEARGEGGIADGTSPWDGNGLPINVNRGWPARDQIGRGRDEWLWTNANPYPPQADEPAYFWNNTYGGSPVPVRVNGGGNNEIHIQEGRDYHVGVPRPGYTPYAYPHPLRELWDAIVGGSDDIGTEAPRSPSGLRVQEN